ncbi:hypothetical protein [Flammeovirga aprica]|uniref:Uncharacterized protein n=1 Tax=Flammeovirga aprica JL-4 TaxID=694437 RepID=A0A7X9RX47_9BACT|nr:hypothetical protein [Flammeovirga aprica]NME70326.1 hypothetical protein [Flammeovirga aprica JL-4]
MITDKINSLFQFIDFLYSNIDAFNKYNSLIEEINRLSAEKKKLEPDVNYKERIEYNSLNEKLNIKYDLLQENTCLLIKQKAIELEVCSSFESPLYYFNGIEAEIDTLKEKFNENDLEDIFDYKQKYLFYRTHTHKSFLSLDFFFTELDELTKRLFDYFKEDKKINEYERFEQRTITVNSLEEGIEHLRKGDRITLPNSFIINPQSNWKKDNIQDFDSDEPEYLKFELLNNVSSNEKLLEYLKSKFTDSAKGKDLSILYKALQELELLNEDYYLTDEQRVSSFRSLCIGNQSTSLKSLSEGFRQQLEKAGDLKRKKEINELKEIIKDFI